MLRQSMALLRISMNEVIASELEGIDREYFLAIAIILLLVVFSPIIVYIIRNAVMGLQLFSDRLEVKVKELKREKRRAETLVYEMLPRSVADNLRQNQATSVIFESATTSFTEIDEFKDIARRCDFLQLFEFLNTLPQ